MCVRFGGPCGLGVNGGVITNAVTGSGEINVEIDVEQTITYTSVTQASCFSLFVPFQFLRNWRKVTLQGSHSTWKTWKN